MISKVTKFKIWKFKEKIKSYFKRNHFFNKVRDIKKLKIDVYGFSYNGKTFGFPYRNYNEFYLKLNRIQSLVLDKNKEAIEDYAESIISFIKLNQYFSYENRLYSNPNKEFNNFLDLTIELYYYYSLVMNEYNKTKENTYILRYINYVFNNVVSLLDTILLEKEE